MRHTTGQKNIGQNIQRINPQLANLFTQGMTDRKQEDGGKMRAEAGKDTRTSGGGGTRAKGQKGWGGEEEVG
jgi:hypothetical protein